MAYSFDRRSDTAKQVRKIARGQVASAIDLIAQGGDFDRTVHELRRRCKKVRGLLRLVRPNFAQFDVENAHFREAADSLSQARDAAVMVETYVAAMKLPWAATIASTDKSRLRRALSKNAAAVGTHQSRPELLTNFGTAMSAALVRIDDWSFKDNGFSLLEPGLRATYSRLCKGLEKAGKTLDPEDLHDWRKDTKYHWFHVTLLRESAGDVLGSRRDHLDRLGELLGDHHNLFVLGDTIIRLVPNAPPSIMDGLLAQQDVLAGQAFDLGRQLAAESPKQMSKRLEQLWKLLPEG